MPGARVAPVFAGGHLVVPPSSSSSSSVTAKVNNGHTGCPNGVLDDGLPLIKSSIAPTTSIKDPRVPQQVPQQQEQSAGVQGPPRNIWTRQVFAHSNSPTTGQFYTHCSVLSHNVHHEPPPHHTRGSSSDDCTSQSYEPIFSRMDTLQHHRPSKKRVHREKGVRRLSIPGLIDIKCQTYTPYEKLMKSLTSDVTVQRDVLLGRRIGFYRMKGEVGTGNFSQVKIALHCLTKEKVAIKILDKSKLDVKTQRMLTREIYCMEKLHHPNLVRLFEVIETLTKVYLVLEYAPFGELAQRINDKGRLKESTSAMIFAQIVSAIDHMHQHHIIHRDIKAENVFFADNDTVKVGDFGFSTEVKNANDLLNTFCGSPPYAAPELFSDENYLGPSVDLWALGVLLYYMVVGSMPFKASTVTGLKKLISEVNYCIPEYISKECSSVIKGLLQLNPCERLSISDLRTCKWLRGQHFPNSLPKYKVSDRINDNLIDASRGPNGTANGSGGTGTGTGGGGGGCKLSPEEKEAQRQLRELGIDEDLLLRSKDKGLRSNIIGTYRILLHRVINQKYNFDSFTNYNRITPFSFNFPMSDYQLPLDEAKLHNCIQAGHELGSLLKILTGQVDDESLPVWPEERVFVDSEGFIIPDALVHLETDRSIKLQHQQLLQQQHQQQQQSKPAMSDQRNGVNCQGDKWLTQLTSLANGNSIRDVDTKQRGKKNKSWKNRRNSSNSSSSSSSKRYLSSKSCILF